MCCQVFFVLIKKRFYGDRSLKRIYLLLYFHQLYLNRRRIYRRKDQRRDTTHKESKKKFRQTPIYPSRQLKYTRRSNTKHHKCNKWTDRRSNQRCDGNSKSKKDKKRKQHRWNNRNKLITTYGQTPVSVQVNSLDYYYKSR